MGEAKNVFEITRNTAFVPNVFDAVEILPGISQIADSVRYYGDRSIVCPSRKVFIKEARNEKEKMLLKMHNAFLKDQGIGPGEIEFVPIYDGHSGIVENLSLNGNVNGENLQFFIVTEDSEKLSQKSGSKIYGSNFDISRKLNNKVFLRESLKNLDECLFPRHEIASNEDEMVEKWKFLKSVGRVKAKVGPLASGEGFGDINSEEDARRFWRAWSPILARYGYEQKIILEQWFDGATSVSVQYYNDSDRKLYLGCSYQHIADNGEGHEGNAVGGDIGTFIDPWIEKEMRRKAELMIDSFFLSIFGFYSVDFIVVGDQVYATEINLRWTASMYLYALEAQIENGKSLSYDLRKVHFGPNPKVDSMSLIERLSKCNTSENMVIPLNVRLFDETGDMFVAVVGKDFESINQTWAMFNSWF